MIEPCPECGDENEVIKTKHGFFVTECARCGYVLYSLPDKVSRNIAAGPDMLKALQAVEADLMNNDPGTSVELYDSISTQISTAIAKAKGEINE